MGLVWGTRLLHQLPDGHGRVLEHLPGEDELRKGGGGTRRSDHATLRSPYRLQLGRGVALVGPLKHLLHCGDGGIRVHLEAEGLVGGRVLDSELDEGR